MPALAALCARAARASVRRGLAKRTDFVFASKVETPMHYGNVVRRGLEPAMRQAGLDGGKPPPRFRDLRHCFASALIAQGEDPG